MIKATFHSWRRRLARIWLELNLQLKVVGVTGSYGKTSTVRAIAGVLSSKYSTLRTDLNLDTQYNLPITLLKIKPWNEVLVLEYGIDRRGEMDAHLSLAKPSIAVLTGISPVHTDRELLGSLEELIQEKSKLTQSLPKSGLAIFNFDDKQVRKIARKHTGRKLFYGLNSRADVWADEVTCSLAQTKFTLHAGREKKMVTTPLLGYPAVYSCLVAYLVGRELGVGSEKILPELAKLTPLAGRLSVEPGPRDSVLVNDAMRANPASTLAGLKSLAQFAGRKLVVMGEMGELGRYAEVEHRQAGRFMAGLGLEMVIGVGELTKYLLEELIGAGYPTNRVYWAKDVRVAAEKLGQVLRPGDLLYLKASLLRHLERVILILQEKEVGCVRPACHHYRPCWSCSENKKAVISKQHQ